MRTFGLRKDKYNGWQVMVQGRPLGKVWWVSRARYRDSRQRGWNRRVSLASGLFIFFGWKGYLVRHDWAPSKPAGEGTR